MYLIEIINLTQLWTISFDQMSILYQHIVSFNTSVPQMFPVIKEVSLRWDSNHGPLTLQLAALTSETRYDIIAELPDEDQIIEACLRRFWLEQFASIFQWQTGQSHMHTKYIYKLSLQPKCKIFGLVNPVCQQVTKTDKTKQLSLLTTINKPLTEVKSKKYI